jgi:hypothetical protein
MPNPTKTEIKSIESSPCRWAKILEEKENNPDVSGQ